MKPSEKQEEFIARLAEHQGILHKICNAYTNTHDDKLDLYQEILFQVWKSYDSFHNESKFSTWVYRIALNTAISWLRKDKRTQEYDNFYSDIFIHDEDERIGKLYEAINLLPKTDRAFILLYLDDYSYKEISEIMGITTSNVGVKISRIKEKLEQLIYSTDL